MIKYEYTKLPDDPVSTTIAAFKALASSEKSFTKEEVEKTIRDTNLFKKGELKEENISYILSELEEDNFFN